MQQWFGEPWPAPDRRAPTCSDDGLRIDTPVGEVCPECDEVVVAGDRGYRMVGVRFVAGERVDAEPRPIVVHAECLYRQMVGGPAHVQELCSCYRGDAGVEDLDLGMTPRDAARAVWDLVMAEEARQWAASMEPEAIADQKVAQATFATFRGRDDVREAAEWN
jgi:hypothetical protein